MCQIDYFLSIICFQCNGTSHVLFELEKYIPSISLLTGQQSQINFVNILNNLLVYHMRLSLRFYAF